MNSRTTDQFWKSFEKLPTPVQRSAGKVYRIWKVNPYHKSLHFKQIHNFENLFSIRVSRGYRAIGVKEENTVIWFWIGSHEEYDKIISIR